MGLHGSFGIMGTAGHMGGHNKNQKILKCPNGCKFYDGSKASWHTHHINEDRSITCYKKEYIDWIDSTNPKTIPDFTYWKLVIRNK